MNTMQIIKMCKNINADYKGMGREVKPEDTLILDTIMRIYNTTTEIDWEEVKWMWMAYLEKGVLPVSVEQCTIFGGSFSSYDSLWTYC